MKTVAIAVQQGAENSEAMDCVLDAHFGRAWGFLLVTPDGADAEILVNDNANASHGAGPGSVGLLTGRGVTTIIAADYGPKAWRAIEAGKLDAWKAPAGTPVRDCLEKLKAGTLNPMKMDVYQ